MALNRDTANINAARRVVDMAEKIAFLQPSAAPFTVLTKRAKKRVVTNPKFEWLEDELAPRWDAVNMATGAAAAVDEIVVDHEGYFTVGDLVKVPSTGEVMRVTEIAAATHKLTVVRGFGETTAADIADDATLLIIGNVNEEGGGARAENIIDSTNAYNYTQIFKTPFSVTGTMDASKLYGGSERARLRLKKGIEHMVDMERAFLFGERKEDTTGAHPARTTRGLLTFLTQNIVDANGALTEAEFEGFLEDGFLYGSPKKLLLASPKVISVINQFAAGKLQTKVGDKTYGLQVMTYLSAHGEVNIVKEPLFEGAVYGGYAALLDMDYVYYCPLSGRDTKLETNIQNNDEDGFKDQYLTEAGIKIQLPKAHALLTGVTG